MTMKAVILAGGLGTRISEESHLRPKPMIEIGARPILWHIMKTYGHYGINDFVICCGYKGYVIKEYFANYFLHMSDVTFDMAENRMEVHQRNAEPWRVTLVDTGDTKPDLLPFICDAAPSKQGKVMPGSHIPIQSPEVLMDASPDYILILPWNIAVEVTTQLANVLEMEARFVVAVPEVRFV